MTANFLNDSIAVSPLVFVSVEVGYRCLKHEATLITRLRPNEVRSAKEIDDGNRALLVWSNNDNEAIT